MDSAVVSLQSVLVLLASSVLAVAVCRSLQLPPLIGYLATGLALGPHALALVSDIEETRRLAEFGVVFLMFSIGLEFSLPKLLAMRRAVFGLGLAPGGRDDSACARRRPCRRPLVAGGAHPRRHRPDALDRDRPQAAR